MSALAPPAEHRLPRPGGDLCWFEWGAPAPGQPSLLLLHATGFHARCWDRVVAALPTGSHVVAVDLRGHGRSYRPDTLADWSRTADDVVALIDALADAGVRDWVAAGHSMGGCCLVRAAALSPAAFRALTLIDPVIFAPDFYDAAADNGFGSPDDHPVARRRNQWRDPDEMVARFAERHPYALWDRDVLDDYCRWGLVPAATGEGLELACPPVLEASAYLGSIVYRPLPDARRLAMPVTVVRAAQGDRGGALDFSVSPTWPGLAAVIPHGQDLDWRHLTHFIPMQDPRGTAALLAAMMVNAVASAPDPR